MSWISDIVNEVFEGIKDNVRGIYNLIRHPWNSLVGTYQAMRHPWQTVENLFQYARRSPIRATTNLGLSIVEGQVAASGISQLSHTLGKLTPVQSEIGLSTLQTNTTGLYSSFTSTATQAGQIVGQVTTQTCGATCSLGATTANSINTGLLSATSAANTVGQITQVSIRATLLLHFDVNKTIMMIDPVSKKDLSYVVMCSLAENVQYQDKWSPDLPKMTYYEYITQHKLIKYKDEPDFKNRVIEEIKVFLEHLQKTEHRLYPEIHRRYENCLKKLKGKSDKLVPAFHRLIAWLKQNKHQTGQDYRILIRTFGQDRDHVMQEIRKEFEIDMIPAEFNEKRRYIQRKADGSKVELDIEELHQVHQAWLDNNQHIAVQDNFNLWDHNKRHWEFGKPLPHDRTCKKSRTIMMDDNVETHNDSQTNILSPFDINTNTFVPVSSAIKEGTVKPIDPLIVIEDDEYFIKIVQNANKLDSVQEKVDKPVHKKKVAIK